MNFPTPELPSAAEEQAALWAARLDGGSLPEADRAALSAWQAEDDRHAALLAEYRRLSLVLERHVPALAEAGAVASPTPPAPVTRRPAWRPAWVLFGAAAAVVVAGAAWLSFPKSHPESVATAAGERRTLTLADGSRIELDAQTSVTVEETRTERHVSLQGGEAFFVVAKNPERPFIVDTPAGSVRVTGTIFNILAEHPSQLDVTVVEGSVQVRTQNGSNQAAPVVLKAGDQFTTERGQAHLTDAALSDVLAWRDGYVVFAGTPLADALARFAHYNGQTIVAGPGTGAISVGGRYRLQDLDGFLSGVERDYDLVRSQDASGTIHVDSRTQARQ